ncbi:VaFE repeat-containing surface-anchored protein [uncultured Mobiluncus sp.]|uniref:VaFE repeat-containing surface-anchored protein n=1 Tax=uncultured Mobiluncus sp. TaxID=293425 RepID=UPI00280418BB|nr:VaFE repeat-containing surface-anchored protein [uncultured Mobiluncus sp.]
MSAIAKNPRQNQPGKPTLVSYKQKGKKSRNWTAGVIASAIAVAWAVGGLVMPSLAATPTAQASVKPTVTVSPDSSFDIGKDGDERYRLVYNGQLFTTKDPQEAAAHYGQTAKVGDFTAQYLPKECITKATKVDRYGTPFWDGYDALDQVAPDRGIIAKTKIASTFEKGFGAWVIFPGGSSTTLPFNASGSSSQAATSNRSAVSAVEPGEDEDTLTLSLEPIEGETADTGATQARIFAQTSDPSGNSATSTEPTGSAKAPQLPASPQQSVEPAPQTSEPSSEPSTPTPVTGPNKAPTATPTATATSGAVPIVRKFEPTINKIDLKFDPSVDKATAIANFKKQVEDAKTDVMKQLDQFVAENNYGEDFKKKMVANLNAQFDNLLKQGLDWLEQQYSKAPSVSKFPGIKACEENGPIVPAGSYILVKNWTADLQSGEPNVWQWAKKISTSGSAPISFLALYPSSKTSSFKVDGSASFCVEPFYGYQLGNHKVYTDPSKTTIFWAKDNPEKAETVKALAWHYAKNNQGADWGRYQNAIWMVIFGITDNGRAWNYKEKKWVDGGATDVKNLIEQAKTAYQQREHGDVAKALDTMHLDQMTTVKKAKDGTFQLTVKLNDYDPNSKEGQYIGDQVYLAVDGATDQNGNPIKKISLKDAVNGVTLKIADQHKFHISFTGSVKDVENPYFIDNPNGPTQAQVVVLKKNLDVSGELKVVWTIVEEPTPTIETTAKVNGADSVPGDAETATFSKADEVITLTDDVKYEKIPTVAGNLYLVGTLKKVSGGVTTTVFTKTTDAKNEDGTKIKGDGTLTGLFSHELKASEVKDGDKFYYEEILATNDPKYAGGGQIDSDKGQLNIIAKHTGENADQTVNIVKNKAQLTLTKAADGAADKASGNVTFTVDCTDGTSATLYAPAKGGAANTDSTQAGTPSTVEITPGATCTVQETYRPAPVNMPVAPTWSATNATQDGAAVPVTENGKTIGSQAKFVMGNAGAINLTATNTYQEQTGGFKVTKFVQGIDRDAAAQANDGKFEFSYTCDNGVAGGSFSLPDNNSWTYEVKGLPVDTKCTVTETKPKAPEGYNVVVKNTNASGTTTESDTVAVKPIQDGSTYGVAFTNYYQPADAAFSLQKVAKYVNGDKGNVDGNFSLSYVCEGTTGKPISGNEIVPANGTPVAVKDGIKAGMTCTIKEDKNSTAVTGANFKSLTFGQSGLLPANILENSAAGFKFKVPTNNATVVVTAKNLYEHKMGSFKLTKKVKADGANPLKDKAFAFRVTCGDEDPVTVNLKNGETWTSKSYLADTECMIHEFNPSNAAVTNTVSYTNAQSLGGDDAKVVIKEGAEPKVEVVATNTVKANYGKFSVTKTVDGDAKAEPATFTFDYKCDDDAKTNGTLDLKAGETKTVDNVLVGTTCYIKEKPVEIDGVTVTPSWVTDLANATGTNAGFKQFTIPEQKDGKAQVLKLEAKNTLDYDKASFTIKKVVQGGAVFEPGTTFKFTYSCTAPNGKTYTQAAPFGSQAKAKFIEVAPGQESAAIVVPKDSKCSVTEPKAQLDATNKQLVNDLNANPLKYVSTSFIPAGKDLASGEQTVTQGNVFQFAATNVYTEKMTGFKFYKAALTGNNAGNHTEQFYFNYSCQTPAGAVKNGVGYDLSAGSDPVKVEKLPVGTKCVVWEKPAVAQANEEPTTTWTVGAAKPVEGKEVKPFDTNAKAQPNGVAFTVDKEDEALMVGATNDFTVPDTKLVVSKTIVAGENTNVDSKTVKLSATCKYPTDNADHVIMDGKTFKNTDKAEFTTDVNGVKIPVGATCTITESADSAKVAGHKWTVEMKEGKNSISKTTTGSVTLDTTAGKNVEVINTYERELGKFKIIKAVTAAKNITVKESYDFSYTCADPKVATQKVEGKVTGVTDTGYKFAENIPVGYKCHITEDQAGAKTEEGSTLSATLSDNDFVVGKDKVVEVNVTNTYSDVNGKFSVKKVIAADSTASIVNGSYNFEYWCVTPDGSKIGTQDAPMKFNVEAGKTWTSGNIPTGSKCSIREVTPSGNTTGIAAEVSWSLNESTTTQGVEPTSYTAVGAKGNFVFGAEGSTAGKFTIGKDSSTTGLTATNKLTYKEVKLSLQKVAEATSAHGKLDYSVANFNSRQGFNEYYRYMNRDFVNMHVTCKSGKNTVVDKTVKVDVNGNALDFGTVPYNSKCTVAELDDESFNDKNALQYGGWRHKAEISATDANGKDLATPVKYAFDMLEPDEEKAAITFDVTSEANVSVKMLNRWDCYASIETDLDAPDQKATADGHRIFQDGIKVIDVKPGQDRVKLTDTVTLKNVTPGKTYTVVERLYSTSQAGQAGLFYDGYLNWKSENGANWDYYAEEVTVPSGATDFTTDISFTIPVELLEEHPEGIAAGIMVFNGGNPMQLNQCTRCLAYGSELTLPKAQSIIPRWSPDMWTIAYDRTTDSRVLSTNKETVPTQKLTDNLKYTRVPAGDYLLYGRLVQTDDTSKSAVDNHKPITVPAGQEFFGMNRVDNEFTLETANLTPGATYVMFEYMLPKDTDTNSLAGKTPAELQKMSTDANLPFHAEVDDICQKLYTPKLKTTASIDKPVTPAVADDATVTVKDKVKWTNLAGGRTYTMTGTLHIKNADGTDGGVLNDPGATATKTFKVDGKLDALVESGEVELTFTVKAKSLKTQTVVAFEEAKDRGVVVATHADITDEDQTVYNPSIGTTASVEGGAAEAEGARVATVDMTKATLVKDSKTKKELSDVAVTDKVAYNSIAPGEYVMYGQLMKINGNNTTAVQTTFQKLSIAKGAPANGTMDLTFPGVKVVSGEKYVVFEKLYKASDFDQTAGKPTNPEATVAEHANPKDEAQTVYVPGVTTDAKDGDGDKYVDPTQPIKIIDTVTGSGLIPGKEYTIDGELMMAGANGEPVHTGVFNNDGDVKVVADKDGKFAKDLTFEMSVDKAKELGLWVDENGQPTPTGKDLVVFENLKLNGKPVAIHHDITDEAQTVHSGKMMTSAIDSSDKNQTMIPGQKNAVITDTVTFTGKFEPKHNYTLVGELHYVTTDSNGVKTDAGKVPGVTVQPVKVTSDAKGVIGEQTMKFTVPADSIVEGKDLVVFETLHDGDAKGNVVVKHANPKDPAQTINVVKNSITTTAYDGGKDGKGSDPSDKNLDNSPAKVVIYDLVDYEGLQVGKEYTVTGTLHYQADATLAGGTEVHAGDPIDAKYVTVTPAKFVAKTPSSKDKGAVKAIVKFEVDKAALATAPVVVFEDLMDGDVTVATHHDINDDSQVVYNPSLATAATVNGAKLVQLQKDQKDVTVDDKVTISNAAPGTYTLKGKLMAEDGKTVVATSDVKDVKVTKGVTVKNVTFTIPADKVKAGAKFVVFEELVDAKGEVVASHKDMASEDQTVRVGSLETTATDKADGDKVADNTKAVTIVDKVDYSGLNLDAKYADGTPKAYLLSGKLMDKETKQPVPGLAPVERVIGPANSVYRADGQADRPVEKVITSGTGFELLKFEVPANLIMGKPVVVFETVYQEGKEYLIHHDINDDSQTVWAPKLATKASAAGERGLVLADAKSTVKDTVTFTGMKVGETYVVAGELWNKTQNKSTGIKVTSKPFKAEKATWTEADFMTFEIPAGTVAENDELVVFETLYLGNKVDGPAESTHEDPNDPAQTVGSGVKPGMKTVLSVDGNRAWEKNPTIPTIPVDSKQLVDTVSYVGLTPGVKYTLNATLMEIGLDGKVSNTGITGTATFTPTEASGTQQVGYNTIPAGTLKPGYKYVAYEQLIRNDKPNEPPLKHEDPKDGNQTVETSYNPSIETDLAQDGTQVIATDAALDLQDKVQMKGLIKGEKYVLVSRLVYNAGQPNETVLADGLERFTAEKVDVTKDIKFNVTADQLKAPMEAAKTAGTELKLVAYEYLTRASLVTGDDDTIKASVTDTTKWDTNHADPNDGRQTVTVVDVPHIGTKLEYEGQKVVWEGDNVKLTDYVEFFNLLPETEYTLSGELKGIAADGTVSDTGVVGTGKFTTPKATNGATRVSGTIKDKTAATVEFTVPLSVLKANDKLVAFESLQLKGKLVAEHKDPKDENQIVKVKHPGVGTLASVDDKKSSLTVWEGVNKEGKKAPETYTVHDVIRMVNVEEGKTYALDGQVYSKTAYDAGNTGSLATNAKTVKVTASMAVDPNADEIAKYGKDVKVYETTMDITVKAADIKSDGDNLVVFEQLWAEGTYESADGGKVTPKGDNKPVATHNDITAKSQSITVNRPEFGSLTLTKAVTGWDENTANVERTNAKYVFTVACTEKGSTDTITLHEGQSATIDGIPVGDKCTITENVQNAEEQAGLKDTVKFTEANGVTVESTKNGEGTVIVGGTPNGKDRVANVTVTAENVFTNEVTIGTHTTGKFDKKASNGDTITDLVKYQNLQGGKYLLHTYFVEYDKAGQAHKIDYVPSEVREVTVEGGYVKGGHSGTWTIDVKVPSELIQEHKTVVLWEDLYRMPQDRDAFETQLSKLPTGKTAAGLIAFHHEENLAPGKGTQWLEVSTHFGGFQVTKVVKTAADLPADVVAKIPTTWSFTYEAKVPDGKTAKQGTALEGSFNLTVDPKDPSKAVSPRFDGFPTGTEITITETDAKAQIPTQAKWKVTWKSEGWTDGAEGTTKTFTITPAATVSVTALNEFSLVTPTLATVARTADDGKMLKPSEDTAVVDTVTYTNLVQGRDYWLKTELVYVDDTADPNDNKPVLGADGNPLVKWTKVTAETDNSEWVVDKDKPMVVPANANPDADVVFFESLYEMTKDGGQPKANDKPIVEHRDNADPKQIITRRPALSLQTTADLSGGKAITAGEGATVNDTVTYSGLKAGADYTLVGTLVKKSDGSIVGSPVTVAGLKAEADGSGSWKMSIPLTAKDTAGLANGEKLVVFEKAYAGNLPKAGTAPAGTYTPVLAHEDLDDASQTVNVVKRPTPPPYTPGTTPPTPPVESKTTTPPTPPVKSETTTPPSTTPNTPPTIPVAPATTLPPMHPKVPPTLARTGAQAAIFGGLSILMIAAGAGIGLLAARRKRQSDAQ